MTLRQQIHALRDEILQAAAANGASQVRLFGSAARGDETAGSDVNLLVALEPARTLLDLARLETRIEQLLTRPVAVIHESGLRGPFRDSVMRDAVRV